MPSDNCIASYFG